MAGQPYPHAGRRPRSERRLSRHDRPCGCPSRRQCPTRSRRGPTPACLLCPQRRHQREPADDRSRSRETTRRDHPARLPARARAALLDRGSAELEATTAFAGATRGDTKATPRRPLARSRRALGATPERLLGAEIELAGFLFESQATHDLRVYAQPQRAEVRFYRDNNGLEIDAIVEATDGRWLAAEIKLGHHRVEGAARHLLALKEKLSPATNAACGALLIIVADSPTYTRPDGILVTSLASLASLGP